MGSLILAQDWRRMPLDRGVVDDLAHGLSLPFTVAAILYRRGILTQEEAVYHLTPSLSSLNEPFAMTDMEKAVDRLVKAVSTRERIAVFGDYDADGVTASAVVVGFLNGLGLDVTVYLPHREREGYGLNPHAISLLASEGRTLLVTVDCGVTNAAEIAHAAALGMDVIVTDHHEPPDSGLPPACAVVNPKRKDCAYPFRELAGVGVAFNLVRALRTRLRSLGFWEGKAVPNLKEYLDLVAIGTIADMVPLLGDNRIFVRNGMEVLDTAERPGIRAMKEACGISRNVTVEDIAFRIAPRINAAGRMAHAHDAFSLLSALEQNAATEYAFLIKTLNEERQREEAEMLREAEAMAEALGERSSYVMGCPSWRRGLLGIVAGRLVERLKRPVILLAIEGDMAHGSGRCPEGLDLYGAISACSRHIRGFGGHRSAAGVHLLAASVPDFASEFEEQISRQLRTADLSPFLPVDLAVGLQELADPEFSRLYDLLEPFGTGYAPPVLTVYDFTVTGSRVVGNRHLKLTIAPPRKKSPSLDILAWGQGEKSAFSWSEMELACTPHRSEWQGRRRMELRLRDARFRTGGR